MYYRERRGRKLLWALENDLSGVPHTRQQELIVLWAAKEVELAAQLLEEYGTKAGGDAYRHKYRFLAKFLRKMFARAGEE